MANATKLNKEEYRNWEDQVLQDKINEMTLDLQKLKFGHAVNPLENPMIIRRVRRNIAELKTEQTRRTL